MTVLRFGGTVLSERTVTVTGTDDLSGLLPDTGYAASTALWTAADRAYDLAAEALARDPDAPVSVVLVTDGESNAGLPASAFLARFAERGPGIPLFAVQAGGSGGELARVAGATGGRVVDADGDKLTEALEALRGCA
ncbi:hypothetical protein ACFQV2_03235 [Actinokineospora soli]|uniref:von Willebrand factor type A domain-containing protein n=1 Tax=Actinokineospora soli TaxID=1048753 RepID=A0ABW2TGC1_9PSEU